VQLDHEFTVPVPIGQAWPVLMDVARIAPCMPGATVTKVDGRDVEGTVKVKVGPITVTYGGTATFLEVDDAAHRAVIEARGKETRGAGTASARVTTQLYEADERTRVTVSTDLSVTGKPAQFGRGVMSDVGAKLLGQFADCLSRELAAPAGGTVPGDQQAPGTPASTATPASPAVAGDGAAGQAPTSVLDATGLPEADGSAPGGRPTAGRRPSAEAIDLLGTAGLPVIKRLAPVLAAVALVAVLVAVLRRRR
jgi:carbon monoxide dehydrogenase subunit G